MISRFKRLSIPLAIALLGAGCLNTTAVLPVTPPDGQAKPRAENWQSVGEGAERAVFAYMNATTTFNVVMYRFASEKYRPRFAEDQKSRTIGAWSETLDQPTLVVNGVYFNEDYSPSGLLKIDGRRVGERRFDLDKSGAIIIASGTVRVLDTARETVDFAQVTDAAQSFPLLISNGKAAVNKPGQHRARRTFIGQDESGRLYVGIVPEAEATLYELSQALMTLGVSWINALNLDGGPSTGLAAHIDERRELINSQTGIPNVIVVERR